MVLERMFGSQEYLQIKSRYPARVLATGVRPSLQFRGLIRHAEQRGDRASQGTTEIATIQRLHERAGELPHDVVGKLVEVSAVAAVEPSGSAGEVKGMIANRADPILRLPIPTALDADSRMQRVVDRIPEQLVCRRGGSQACSTASPNRSDSSLPAPQALAQCLTRRT
jgi:hypothetical protein